MATPSEGRSIKNPAPRKECRRDEGTRRPEVIDQSGVGSDQLATFSLREGDIEAVINTDSGLAGDSLSAKHQRYGREKAGRVHHEFDPQPSRVGHDSPPPGLREGVSRFQGE
jgi:hypothetical protein